jgi:hypothetical protein
MAKKLIGLGPDQVPTNSMLGSLAYQNTNGASFDRLNLPSFPTAPQGHNVGDIYYNTLDGTIYISDGTDWNSINQLDIVKDGLVLHWDASDPVSYPGSGTTIYDVSGSGTTYNGTLSNGVGYSAAQGGYLTFDGINDQIDSNYTQPVGSVSWGFWAWHESLTNPDDQSYQLQGIQASGGYCYYGIEDGGGVYGYIKNTNINPSVNLSAQQWYYMTLTYNSSDGVWKAYVNGEVIDNGTTSNGSTSTTLYGGAINSNHHLYGRGSEWQFYERALTDAEVLQNYNAGLRRYQ